MTKGANLTLKITIKFNIMEKITLKSVFGNIIFEHETENNTLLKTLNEALKISNANLRGADLSNADLRYANLRGADLSNADLRYADLRYADLSNANLRGADLSNANLRGANLSNAYLRYADLSNANLRGADLSNADLRYADLSGANTTNTKLPIYSKWIFSIENETLNIGCKSKTFSEWKKWFEESKEEFSTKRNTEDFKRLQAMFYAYKAYYNFLNK